MYLMLFLKRTLASACHRCVISRAVGIVYFTLISFASDVSALQRNQWQRSWSIVHSADHTISNTNILNIEIIYICIFKYIIFLLYMNRITVGLYLFKLGK